MKMQKLKLIKSKLHGLREKKDIINKVKLMGFEPVFTSNPNDTTIYIDSKNDIVVKFPAIYSGSKFLTEIPEIACPTETIILEGGYLSVCFIQPLINDNEDDIFCHPKYSEFMDKIYGHSELTDIHVGNIGIYKGKLIIHDW